MTSICRNLAPSSICPRSVRKSPSDVAAFSGRVCGIDGAGPEPGFAVAHILPGQCRRMQSHSVAACDVVGQATAMDEGIASVTGSPRHAVAELPFACAWWNSDWNRIRLAWRLSQKQRLDPESRPTRNSGETSRASSIEGDRSTARARGTNRLAPDRNRSATVLCYYIPLVISSGTWNRLLAL